MSNAQNKALFFEIPEIKVESTSLSWDNIGDKITAFDRNKYDVTTQSMVFDHDAEGNIFADIDGERHMVSDVGKEQVIQRICQLGLGYHLNSEPEVLVYNLNHHLNKRFSNENARKGSDTFVARCREVNGKKVLRGIVTERYGKMDNMQIYQDMRRNFESAYAPTNLTLNDNRMNLRIFNKHFHDASGPQKVNDRVSGGIDGFNSEIGDGPISLAAIIWRLVCLNGMKVRDMVANSTKRHLGTNTELTEFFSLAMPRLESMSNTLLNRTQEAYNQELPAEMMADLYRFAGKTFHWGDAQTMKIYENYVASLPEFHGKHTLFGVVQAITENAKTLRMDERLSMESDAGDIMMLDTDKLLKRVKKFKAEEEKKEALRLLRIK